MRTQLCDASALEPELGAAVLLDDARQLALFRVGKEIFAVANIDPYSGAAVMSRGIVGEHEGRPVVASPLLKQRFYLDDGTSLSGDGKDLATAKVEEADGKIWLVG